jgi:hypothetical protein
MAYIIPISGYVAEGGRPKELPLDFINTVVLREGKLYTRSYYKENIEQAKKQVIRELGSFGYVNVTFGKPLVVKGESYMYTGKKE